MANPSTPPPIKVNIEQGKTSRTEYTLSGTFRIGRNKSCDIRFTDDVVSRQHAEIRFEDGAWQIVDLQSGNGTFIDGREITTETLKSDTRVSLGQTGPVLRFVLKEPVDPLSLTQYKKRYFDSTEPDAGTPHTMMIRRAFAQVQKKQKKRYLSIIVIITCLLAVTGAYALYARMKIEKQKVLAENIFYAMKSLEIEFAEALETARLSKDSRSKKLVEKYKTQHREMEKNYDQFLDTLDVYGKKVSREKKLILRIARTFGECEMTMPDEFADEVMGYIKKWQATRRYERAISRAGEKQYIPKIVETMSAHDLPPQFFYLALQESNFNIDICGPETKYGIAKGMWQFIPGTATKYGLRVGPLVKVRQADPRDERHHFGRSTLAAARYIRDIYNTEAQASGLLVMASYNWGERRVIRLIRTLPENPRERNFWQVLRKYKKKIPKETYDYVFYIISAAVIGEDPRLFGFDFDNPLASAISQNSQPGLR